MFQYELLNMKNIVKIKDFINCLIQNANNKFSCRFQILHTIRGKLIIVQYLETIKTFIDIIKK